MSLLGSYWKKLGSLWVLQDKFGVPMASLYNKDNSGWSQTGQPYYPLSSLQEAMRRVETTLRTKG